MREELIGAARILENEKLFGPAYEWYERIWQMDAAVEVLLHLSRLKSGEARRRPHEADQLIPIAQQWVEEYLEKTEGPERIPGILAQARLFWQIGKFGEMRKMLDAQIGQVEEMERIEQLWNKQLRTGKEKEDLDRLTREVMVNNPSMAELVFERGKVLSLLKEETLAESNLLFASKNLRDRRLGDLADLHLVAMYGRLHDPLCQAAAEALIRVGSPYRPIARILLGRYFLHTHRADPYEPLLLGLRELDSLDVLEEQRFNLKPIYGELKNIRTEGADAETLRALARIMDEVRGIYEDQIHFTLEAADLFVVSGDAFRVRAGTTPGAGRLRETAAGLYYRAAEIYAEIQDRADATSDRRSFSLLRSGNAFFKGGWYEKAAEQYLAYYDFRPTDNHEGLYREALSYARAGIYVTDTSEARDAVTALGDYIRETPPGSEFFPRALLERGKIFMELQRFGDASLDFDRVLRQPDMPVGPQTWEWAEAKRLKGAAELERALEIRNRMQDPKFRRRFVMALSSAKSALMEYVERYVKDTDPTERGVRVLFDLARTYMADENWSEAEGVLRRSITMGKVLVGKMEEGSERAYLLADFLLGDAVFSLGRYEEAADTYRAAYNRHVARLERLWGLLGQAHSAFRLGKGQEGRQLFQKAQELYDKNEKVYAASLGGYGRDFWTGRLQTVQKERERAGG